MNKRIFIKFLIMFLLIIGVNCYAYTRQAVTKSTTENADNYSYEEMHALGHELSSLKSNNIYIDNIINEDMINEKVEAICGSIKGMDAPKLKETIIDNVTKEQALYLAACDSHITVTNEEVTEFINKIRETIDNNKESKEELFVFLEGYGMSEDAYWESLKNTYTRKLIIFKYINNYYVNKYLEKNNYSKDEQGVITDNNGKLVDSVRVNDEINKIINGVIDQNIDRYDIIIK